MERRSAARVAKWRGRRDTSDAHQQLRALRKLELMEEIKERVVYVNFRMYPPHPRSDPSLTRTYENGDSDVDDFMVVPDVGDFFPHFGGLLNIKKSVTNI